jgi:hypothetical protein
MRTKIGNMGSWDYCRVCGKEAEKHLLCKAKAEKDIFKYWVFHLCNSKECFDFHKEYNVISEVSKRSFKIINRYNYKIDLRDYAKYLGFGIASGVIEKEDVFSDQQIRK